ncbi:hypothetical protein SAMN05421770_104148 [Granulicella rosea]|uniref:DUF91 domain-containing protein n=1 Tax=Granulicella rosea TaxID=474952 RepID=A0A239JWB6_9BACT|nr:hypothetical protein [Granulicella rosea]SNT09703.1 hypothetical protein SAMN05421770_104148 [Granulicella rosea]
MVAKSQPEQTPAQLASALEDYLAEYPRAVVLEHGKALFDLGEAKYTLSTEHGRCTLHLWGETGNLVRRIVAVELRNKVLKLSTLRFGQTKPQILEIAGDKDRRTPTTRDATRTRYVKVLERALARTLPEWTPDGFRTAMDLEKSFGPAYARGMLVRGVQNWAVIGVNAEETPATIDGILTLGILWLEHCRSNTKRLVQGLKLVVPPGMGALTLARMAWLNGDAAQWELWELTERDEELMPRDTADQGNLASRLIHAPNVAAARERFAESAAQVMALVPPEKRHLVEHRVRSGTEMAFLLHGLEFARARLGTSAESFNRMQELTFGAGANETPLTPANEQDLRAMIARLFERRSATGNKKDPLYRMQSERWLEGALRQDIRLIDPKLDPAHVYTQVPAIAASDRGMLDLLSVHEDGRLAVIEIKADEDLHLALQGLDYWVRVRWHHTQNPDYQTGLGEFQRHGYFGGIRLSVEAPRLYLVAPALRVHPATEVVLRYLSKRVDWTLVAVDERWRAQVKTVWRKRSTDLR